MWRKRIETLAGLILLTALMLFAVWGLVGNLSIGWDVGY